jgi:hypothetical protein
VVGEVGGEVREVSRCAYQKYKPCGETFLSNYCGTKSPKRLQLTDLLRFYVLILLAYLQNYALVALPTGQLQKSQSKIG